MNYELAKELAMVGFPQDGIDGHGVFPNGDTINASFISSTKDIYYAPTLEELIEACGENFLKLLHVRDYPEWYAYSYKGTPEVEYEGSTPTEAVARLWLALNKNN